MSIQSILLASFLFILSTGCNAEINGNAAAEWNPLVSNQGKSDSSDYVDISNNTGNTCKDSCGEQSTGDCWCDDMCTENGDCCADKEEVCTNPTAPPEQGCSIWLLNACESTEFCNYATNASCGFADASGACKTKPEFCTQEFEPVCGCNGQTYSNECTANMAGVSVSQTGVCPPAPPAFCGGIPNAQCPENFECVVELTDNCSGAADCGGTCQPLS